MRRPARVQHVRLTDPDLDFWIDVRVTELNGRWLAVADLADTPELGVGEDAQDALALALSPLGAAIARRMTGRAFVGSADLGESG